MAYFSATVNGAYRLTEKGVRVALLFVLFHQRICGPLANSFFHRRPPNSHTPTSKSQAAYQKQTPPFNKS
jgi:hypothetical protein